MDQITVTLDETKTRREERGERRFYTCFRDPDLHDVHTVLVTVKTSELNIGPGSDSDAIEQLAASEACEKAREAFWIHDRAERRE